MRALLLTAILTLVLILTSKPASAEYRVFKLSISDENGAVQRQVLSTLDHLQYPTYYPLRPGEQIQYVDSWMCWERGNGFKNYCPSPKNQTDSKPRNPAEDPTPSDFSEIQ